MIYYYCYCLLHLLFNANSVDPDQTPRFAASDLDLHCLPTSLGTKCVKYITLKRKIINHINPLLDINIGFDANFVFNQLLSEGK